MTPIDIIYIEDNEIEAQILRLGLRKYDIQVLHIADTGPAGLSLLDTPRYQDAVAVFIDWTLVGMNGLELARQLRQRGDRRPFFLITAGRDPDPELLRQLNVTFVRKPFDFQHLAQMVQACTP